MDPASPFPLLETLFPVGPARAALEWVGTLMGVGGALLLALNGPHAKWAWPMWMLSNVCFIVFGLIIGAYGLVTMQAGFFTTSSIGCWKWIIAPYRTGLQPQRAAALTGDAG